MKASEQLSNEITNNSLIVALGLLVHAKELLDEADINNRIDEWHGIIPVSSIEVGEQVYVLKNMLGIPLNQDEIDYYERQSKSIDKFEQSTIQSMKANSSVEKTDVSNIQSKDNLGLHSAVNGLYLAIENDDLETALKYVNWIENVTRTYADPRSEAHDHLHLFDQVQSLYSAIEVEDVHQVKEVINKISSIANDGINRAKFDNKFNELWDTSHNQ